MAADASGLVARLERNYTQTLDPIGCRLAVEGRLVSEDADVLSEKLRRSSLTDDASRAGSNAFEAAAAHAFDAARPAGDAPQQQLQAQHAPVQNGRRQSSSPMPDSAFSQASQLPTAADGSCSCGDGSTCPSSCSCACHNMAPWDSRAHAASSTASNLVMQDTLVDPLTGVGQPLRTALSLSNGPSPMDSMNLEQVASLSMLTDSASSASDSLPAAIMRSNKPSSPSRLGNASAPAGAAAKLASMDVSGGTPTAAAPVDACACPPYAVKSTCGKRTCMEDAYALCPNICELPLSPSGDEMLADKLPLRIASAFEQSSASTCLSPSHSAPAAAHRPQPTASADLAAQAYRRQFSHDSHQTATAAAAGASDAQQRQQGQQQRQAGSSLSLPPLPPQSSDHAPPTPPQQARTLQHCTDSNASASSDTSGVEKLHFFAVYDGHGGVEASQHCAKRLHHHLSVALVSMLNPLEASDSVHGPSTTNSLPGVQSNVEGAADAGGSTINHFLEAEAAAAVLAEEAAKRLRSRANSMSARGVRFLPVFGATEQDDTDGTQEVLPLALADELLEAARQQQQQQQQRATASADATGGATNSTGGDAAGAGADAAATNASVESAALGEVEAAECASSEGSDGSNGSASRYAQLEEALRGAFLQTDEEFAKDGTAGLVGSTAVVSLIGTRRIWVANCGDSRAVLCRGGQAIQVTDDHKPEREDEAERVEKAGGQVLYWNGHRVMGVLAMSRAIGDHCLRPYVIPEPEITVFARHPSDELLLMASDGLWDVMPNQEAMDLALRSIRRAQIKGASRKAAARIACTVLTKAALDRGSRDNITVVMIDLATGAAAEASRKQGAPAATAAAVAAAPSAATAAAGAPAGDTAEAAAAPAPAYVSPFRTASGSSSSTANTSATTAAAGTAGAAAAGARPQQPAAAASQPAQLPPLPQQRQRADTRGLLPTHTEPIPASSGAASKAAADTQQQLFPAASAQASSTAATAAAAAAREASASSAMNRQASTSPFSMHALFPLEGELGDIGPLAAGGPGPAGDGGACIQGLEMAAPAASSNASGDCGDAEAFGELAGPFALAQLSVGAGQGGAQQQQQQQQQEAAAPDAQ